jgi:hypothetical protein
VKEMTEELTMLGRILEGIPVAIFSMFVVFTVLLALWASIVVFNAILNVFIGGRSQERPNQASR